MRKVPYALEPMNPYRPFKYGFMEYDIPVGNSTRKMVVYVPDDVSPSAPGIFIVPQSGISAEDFLKQSNWQELCDSEERKERLIVVVVESGADGWDTNEVYGKTDGDVAYVYQAYKKATDFTDLCIHEAKRYLVGYGDGAAIAQMVAMWDPAEFAGVAAIDTEPLQAAYMEAAKADACVLLNGFSDPNARRGIRKGDLPMPVWLISGEDLRDSKEAAYWRNANGIQDSAHLIDRGIWEYVRTSETDYPSARDKNAYRLWISQENEAGKNFGLKINRKVWKDFLSQVRRFMSEAGGSLRMTVDPVKDLHMQYRYEPVQGWMREWYIHVPTYVKEHPEEKVPLVFAMHGHSCTGETYVGCSCWQDVADQYHFIVIFPSALPISMENAPRDENGLPLMGPWTGWNHMDWPDYPDEYAFFRFMLEDAKARFSIDETRIYASGHSHGSVMTQYLGLTMPELFAAIAPCSGILHLAGGENMLELQRVKARKNLDMPIWMWGGECEPWVLDYIPEPDNRTGKSLSAWHKLNEMPEGELTFPVPYTQNGEYRDSIFYKNSLPMIRWTTIDYFPHGVTPDQTLRIWTEFFSKYSRNADGTVAYHK